MAKKTRKDIKKIEITTLTHEDATRKNIPPAEYQSMLDHEQAQPVAVVYPRESSSAMATEITGRNRDLDP